MFIGLCKVDVSTYTCGGTCDIPNGEPPRYAELCGDTRLDVETGGDF